MKFGPASDFCVWVVPPRGGRVRKVRFSFKHALLLASFFFVLGGTFVFIVGDYARVQFARAKNFIALQLVTSERDELASSNGALQVELDSLKEANDRVSVYEKNVRQRVDELASVLNSVSALGLNTFESEHSPEGTPADEPEGVGGAEVDCAELKDPRCKESIGLRSDIAALLGSVNDGAVSQSARESENLVAVLDFYISLLRSLPFLMPATGHVTSGWGMRLSPFSRTLKMHEGLDFSMSHGSQVISAGDGLVSEVKRNSTYGLMVDVDHGFGLVTRYAHLSKALVAEGEHVCGGEIIGLAGSTGRSTGPHLHYEIRTLGKAINPMEILKLGEQIVNLL